MKNKLKNRVINLQKSGELVFAFLIGSFLYSLIEISTRGFTHWSMTITGGICLAYIYIVSTETQMNMFFKCAAGAVFITAIEFTVGYIVNIKLRWNVWDYSDMPLNLMGQICIPFSGVWFFLCYVGCKLSEVIKRQLA